MFIRNPEYPTWKASSYIVNRLLGLDNNRLPREGMPPRVIQGIKVWVAPLPERAPGEKWKRSTHRVLAECPRCARTLSAGRLHQHKCKGA